METQQEGLKVSGTSTGRIRHAVKNGQPLLGVTHIATHEWPHLDEIAALTLLTIYGEKAFPGISSGFKLSSVSSYQIRKSYGEDAWYELLSEGILTIGTGGGPLDDHYDDQGEAHKQGSSTGRVAYFLGIENEPEVKHLLRYVDHEDNNGDSHSLTGTSGETARSAQFFMLATAIKTTWRMMRQEKKEKELIGKVEHFMNMIKMHILDQRAFIEETGKILSTIQKIPLPLMTPSSERITTPTLVVTRSNSERASAIIRANSGKDVVAILQIRSNGQFCLFSANKSGEVKISQIDDVVKALRSEIIKWKNKNLPAAERIRNDWQETRKEGYHPGTDELYYFREGGMIFNGSLTQPDVPGLVGENVKKFPFNEEILIDIVTIALEDRYWPKESHVECSSGKCPASDPEKNYRCNFFSMGLYRCYTNRKGMKS